MRQLQIRLRLQQRVQQQKQLLLWLLLLLLFGSAAASKCKTCGKAFNRTTHYNIKSESSLYLSARAMDSMESSTWHFLSHCISSDTFCSKTTVTSRSLNGGFELAPNFDNANFSVTDVFIPNVTRKHHGILYWEQFPDIYYEAFNITVYSEPTLMIITTNSTSAIEGNDLLIRCTTAGANPMPKIDLQFNKSIANQIQILENSEEINDWIPFENFTQSILVKVTRDLQGHSLSCVANNSEGASQLAHYTFNVLYSAEANSISELSAIQNSTITFQCNGTGMPSPDLELLSPSNKTLVKSKSAIKYKLEMKSKSYAGKYKCIASNSISRSISITNIKLLYSPIVTVNHSRIERPVNSRVVIACSADASPAAATAQWQHTVTGELHKGWNLDLKLHRKHNGMWRCNVTNHMRPSQGRSHVIGSGSATANITVQYPPGQPHLGSIRKNPTLGGEFSIQCFRNTNLSGQPLPKIYWFHRNGKNFSESGGSLYLRNVSHADTGEYVCRAQNHLGFKDASIFITVQQSPHWLTSLPQQPITTRRGRRGFGLECAVFAVPRATIRWLRDSKPVDANWFSVFNRDISQSDGKIIQRSNLNFTSKNRSTLLAIDNARFACEAKNNLGTIISDVDLQVQYSAEMIKPNGYNMNKNNITITKIGLAKNSKTTLTCKAKGVPSPLIKFYSPNGFEQNPSRTTESAQTQQTIAHLDSVQDLGDYRCLAKNQLGTATQHFLLVEASKPDSPRDLKAVASGWDFVTLSWSPGFSGGYAVGYSAIAVSNDANAIVQSCDSNHFHNFTQLMPANNYSIQITATNSLGSSNSTENVRIQTRSLEMPKATKVWITDKNELEIVALRNFCYRIEASDDGGHSWAPQTPLCKSSDDAALIVNPRLLFRVSLCLLQRNEVCGEPVLSTDSMSSLPEIPSSTIAIVGGCCSILILLLFVVLLYFCCKRPKQYKGMEAVDIQENRQTQHHEIRQYQKTSDGKPYALVQPHPSASVDNIAASAAAAANSGIAVRRSSGFAKHEFDDVDVCRQSGVFATLRSGRNPIDSCASNPTIFSSGNDYDDESLQPDPYVFDSARQKRIVYEVVV